MKVHVQIPVNIRHIFLVNIYIYIFITGNCFSYIEVYSRFLLNSRSDVNKLARVRESLSVNIGSNPNTNEF